MAEDRVSGEPLGTRVTLVLVTSTRQHRGDPLPETTRDWALTIAHSEGLVMVGRVVVGVASPRRERARVARPVCLSFGEARVAVAVTITIQVALCARTVGDRTGRTTEQKKTLRF